MLNGNEPFVKDLIQEYGAIESAIFVDSVNSALDMYSGFEDVAYDALKYNSFLLIAPVFNISTMVN